MGSTRPLALLESTELLPLVGAAVTDESCARAALPDLQRDFVLATRHGSRALWIRRNAEGPR